MKTNQKSRKLFHLPLTIMVIISLLLTSCSDLPSSLDAAEELQGISENGEITVGSHLTVKNTDDRLTLLNNMDALAADGLYYASWTAGNPEPYENSDGETVDLYDAQLYLLLGEFKSSDTAQETMDNWLETGRMNYDVTDEETLDCNGYSYLLITYNVKNPDNPYAHGVSAFGVNENTAVCVELTCQEDYTEDLHEMLIAFLSGCSYQ